MSSLVRHERVVYKCVGDADKRKTGKRERKFITAFTKGAGQMSHRERERKKEEERR